MSSAMYSYQVRVRARRYLWGGSGLSANLNTATPLFMTLHVQDSGEAVQIGQSRQNGGSLQEISLGMLGAGESYTIALNNICGVFADSQNRVGTSVTCTIHGGQ